MEDSRTIISEIEDVGIFLFYIRIIWIISKILRVLEEAVVFGWFEVG